MSIKTSDCIKNVGDRVTVSGVYVCVPCGYMCHFNEGDIFPRCFACLVGKKLDGDDYMRDLGLWELKEKDDK